MKTLCRLSGILIALVFSGLAFAQAPMKSPERVSADLQLVKQIEFTNTTLRDAIKLLQKECPGFQAVVVPDPRYPDFVPVLPNLRLKNLPLGQVMEVIKRLDPDQLRVDSVYYVESSVWIFRIRRMNEVRKPGPPVAVRPPVEVEVFRLGPLVPKNATDRSKALNDILSLLQAVVDASGPSNLMMKVHAPTETLIVRGNSLEVDMIRRALATLQQTQAEKNFEAEAKRRTAILQAKDAEIARLRAELGKAGADAKAQVEFLNAELERRQQVPAEKQQQVPADRQHQVPGENPAR